MGPTSTWMLFCPPQPPLRLDPDQALVLGRSRSCGLRVGGGDASRRHAEIVFEGGGFHVRDLGSTNGTFVNGEPVDQRALQPGDRIQIGSQTITFCEVRESVERGDETGGVGDDKTILVERRVPSEVFRGELAEIPAFAVLQILEMGRKTGRLRIDSVGDLWLDEGHPVHAATKDQVGFDAALAIVNGASGRFDFEPGEGTPDRTITASVTELLLEASRLFDESGAPTS